MTRPFGGRTATLLSTLLLALLASACGGGTTDTNTATTNANTSADRAATPATTPAADRNSGAASSAGRAKLNLNTATEAELKAGVPNLGDRMAHEFEEYRPYRSILQFRKEMAKYVKPEQIAEYEKYVFVPIVPNESDAATLQQIPGLEQPEAEALIKGRPYASNDAFIEKLSGLISADELAAARTLLSAG